MSLLSMISLAALLALVAFMLTVARGGVRGTWLVPAGLSATFGALSLVAVVREGPLGFWAEHTDSLWGVQVWVDLLLAFGIGWTFLVPRARALGVRPLPWLVAVLLTGSIGLLAMIARVLYLDEGSAPARSTAP